MSKYILCLVTACLFFSTSFTQADSLHEKTLLPNGWSLSPIGKSLELGDLPLNLIVSPSKKFMAVTNNGQSVQSIQLIDPAHDKVLSEVVIPKSWLGLAFSADEKYLYASGGNDNLIVKYRISNNQLIETDKIKLGEKWPEKISPAGMQIDDKTNTLFVVTKENNSLYAVNLGTGESKRFGLGAEAPSFRKSCTP